jgi:hypothetical protein
VLTAGLLVLALRRPLKGVVAGGQRVTIDWRLPALSAATTFLRFAGPVAFVLLTKCFMYSARHSLVPVMLTLTPKSLRALIAKPNLAMASAVQHISRPPSLPA